jgi:hypothetical protein
MLAPLENKPLRIQQRTGINQMRDTSCGKIKDLSVRSQYFWHTTAKSYQF